MIGGVTYPDGLPCLPDRVTLTTGVKFSHQNVSRWGNPPRRDYINFFASLKSVNRQNKSFAWISGLPHQPGVPHLHVIWPYVCLAWLPEAEVILVKMVT